MNKNTKNISAKTDSILKVNSFRKFFFKNCILYNKFTFLKFLNIAMPYNSKD